MNKTFAILVKMLLGGAIFYLLLRKVSWESVAQQFTSIGQTGLILSIIVCIVMYILAGLRWKVILQMLQGELTLLSSVKIMFIGLFFNQVLITSVGGEAVRSFYAYKNGIRLRTSITSVFLDRFFALFVLLTIVPCGAAFLIRTYWGSPLFLLMLAMLGAILVGFIALLVGDKIKLPSKLKKISELLETICEDSRTLFLSWQNFLTIYVWSLAVWCLTALVVYFLAVALALNLSYFQLLLLVPVVILISIIPISIGGWGIREGAFIFLLAPLAVSSEQALALSLWFGIVMLLSSLPGVAFWLFNPVPKEQLDAFRKESQ